MPSQTKESNSFMFSKEFYLLQKQTHFFWIIDKEDNEVWVIVVKNTKGEEPYIPIEHAEIQHLFEEFPNSRVSNMHTSHH